MEVCERSWWIGETGNPCGNAVGIGVVRARYCNETDCSIDFFIAKGKWHFHGQNSREEFRASRMPDRTIHKRNPWVPDEAQNR